MDSLRIRINKQGNVNCEDAERFIRPIIYNLRDLHKYHMAANNLETYLKFKVSEERMLKNDIFPGEVYPRKEIQVLDIKYSYLPQFIGLTKDQKEELKSQGMDFTRKMIRDDFMEDD